MRLPNSFLALLLLLAPANAGETPWQDMAPGVRMRVVSAGEIAPDGTTRIGLELDMPQTTKTYWRVPGETGLPMALDWTGSTGIAHHRIDWPYPTREEGADYTDYVYRGPTVLPLTLQTTADAPVAELAVVLGLCSDICVPAQARFALPLRDDEPDRANALRLRQAMAEVPLPWDGAQPPVGAIEMHDAMLRVHLTDPAIAWESLIAATNDGAPLFGAPQPLGAGWVGLPVLGMTAGDGLRGRPIQLTFMTDMGAFEWTQAVSGEKP